MKSLLYRRLQLATHLLVRGPDAATFLQGQFTNDLRSARGQPVTYGLWLNQKGRVLADSFILRQGDDHFEVISLTSSVTVIRPRLEDYIIADDVTLEDRTEGAMGWLLVGADVDSQFREWGVNPPDAGSFARQAEAVIFRGRSVAGPNGFVLPDHSAGVAWSTRFADLAPSAGREISADDLAARRIGDGLPEIPLELGPGDLPNEGGLEHDAVSFTKGCYLGQEVMARLHNLGQVRRRLFVVSFEPDAPDPAKGAELYAGDKRVGDLRGIAGQESQRIGLAMLHTSFVRSGDRLALTSGGAATVQVERIADGRVR